jgi:Spy/CpxP family protein refolding chaperone
MKLRLYAASFAMMAAVLLTSSFSYADKEWEQYLGLSKSQRVQLRMDNQTRKGTVDPAKQDRDAATQSLVNQVLANAGDPAVQPILSQILGDIKTIDGAEENYWQSLMGSLNPIQVAKIYLKDHPPKNPTAAAPAPANPAPNSGKGFNWNAYFELSTDQETQLKAAEQAKNGQTKPIKDEKEAAIEQLSQLVQSNAADTSIQPTLRTLLTDDQTEHQVEQAFWGTTLPGFLTPTQVSKLYLHRRTPKGVFTPPPPAAGPSN